MKSLILVANVLLVAAGLGGSIWKGGAEEKVLEVLACFVVLSAVGLCSIVAIATNAHIASAAAIVVNRLALVLVALLLLLAFVVSPGSGAAALPVLGSIAAINILTLNQVGGFGETSRSTRSRARTRAPG